MSIFVRAGFDVRNGQQSQFEEIARELTARAAEEPGTLTYRWFGPDRGSYLVIEQYADTSAAVAHNERSADLLARVETSADLTFAELYGTLGPELLAWVAARPQVTAYPDLAPIHDRG
jgi:quinol monooxygenase YgiN